MIIAIPPPYVDLICECSECSRSDTPSALLGHLVEQHNYTVEQASRSLQNWLDEFPKFEDGSPMFFCSRHGACRADQECYGCRGVDQKIDKWKENGK